MIEIEDGVTENESTTFAVRAAIEAAVLALIKQGDERGYWKIGPIQQKIVEKEVEEIIDSAEIVVVLDSDEENNKEESNED